MILDILHLERDLRSLPIGSSDDEIRRLIVDWSEHLAAKRFKEAFEMFSHDNRHYEWTPRVLEKTIQGYGVPDIDQNTLDMMHENWGVSEFVVTSLEQHAERDEILGDIEVDRETDEDDDCLGFVEYCDMPICGKRSMLTARFHIIQVDHGRMGLELLDIHVL